MFADLVAVILSCFCADISFSILTPTKTLTVIKFDLETPFCSSGAQIKTHSIFNKPIRTVTVNQEKEMNF